MAFKRTLEIKVGNDSEAYLISKLHCSFKVHKEKDLTNNKANFIVYNANEHTRNTILKENQKVEISAGYEDEGNTLLFVGNITQSFDKKSGGDIMTEIEAHTVQGATKNNAPVAISVSYGLNSDISMALEEVTKALGLALYGKKLIVGIKMKNGFVFSGMAKDCLKRLGTMLDDSNIILFNDNGTLFVQSEKQEKQVEVAYLSYDSGLLDAKRKNETKTKKDEDKEDVATIVNKIEAVSLLNGKIEIGKAIKVEDGLSINESVLIETLVHSGTNFGKGKNTTTCEGVIL